MIYKMRQKFFALGHDFTIQNEVGQDVYEVDGRFISLGNKLFQEIGHFRLAIEELVEAHKPSMLLQAKITGDGRSGSQPFCSSAKKHCSVLLRSQEYRTLQCLFHCN